MKYYSQHSLTLVLCVCQMIWQHLEDWNTNIDQYLNADCNCSELFYL